MLHQIVKYYTNWQFSHAQKMLDELAHFPRRNTFFFMAKNVYQETWDFVWLTNFLYKYYKFLDRGLDTEKKLNKYFVYHKTNDYYQKLFSILFLYREYYFFLSPWEKRFSFIKNNLHENRKEIKSKEISFYLSYMVDYYEHGNWTKTDKKHFTKKFNDLFDSISSLFPWKWHLLVQKIGDTHSIQEKKQVLESYKHKFGMDKDYHVTLVELCCKFPRIYSESIFFSSLQSLLHQDIYCESYIFWLLLQYIEENNVSITPKYLNLICYFWFIEIIYNDDSMQHLYKNNSTIKKKVRNHIKKESIYQKVLKKMEKGVETPKIILTRATILEKYFWVSDSITFLQGYADSLYEEEKEVYANIFVELFFLYLQTGEYVKAKENVSQYLLHSLYDEEYNKQWLAPYLKKIKLHW